MIALVRYGIGVVMVIGGIVMVVLNPGGFGVDGFAMAVGGGLSVLLINFLFRLGVSGDQERRREEEARRYLEEHGHWPDEAPRHGHSAEGSRAGTAGGWSGATVADARGSGPPHPRQPHTPTPRRGWRRALAVRDGVAERLPPAGTDPAGRGGGTWRGSGDVDA